MTLYSLVLSFVLCVMTLVWTFSALPLIATISLLESNAIGALSLMQSLLCSLMLTWLRDFGDMLFSLWLMFATESGTLVPTVFLFNVCLELVLTWPTHSGSADRGPTKSLPSIILNQ